MYSSYYTQKFAKACINTDFTFIFDLRKLEEKNYVRIIYSYIKYIQISITLSRE